MDSCGNCPSVQQCPNKVYSCILLCIFQVSWVRHEGLHIIGAGRYTYTSDQRLQAIHPEDSNDWILRIRNVRSADQGRYECQINTKDHKRYPFNLKVVGKAAYSYLTCHQ